ncbi:hypothetical protein MBEHAL_0036 [Halarchaeum acidiphilum MH1-52-1]|uniref:Cupin type-2 domain-containing protein n=1 Tax=Halarchaeum acidiphilum MH1-52-1 TaxID=1261545 RepID=U2YCG4_9EURY|nr:cupin domain-containing protein [Halarchaeum acidiphilum]GAD51276.1 hypothetical protein MBEHAL_0036 [Halarchaeum acidiphilum MH1-52-1]
MGYHTIDPDELDPTPERPCDQRSITDAAGLDNFALNVYTARPGESIPLAYHVHEEQEEAFYVLSGDLHVETPEGEFVVGAGEAFVAEPRSPHFASVPEDADEPVRAVAVGAPNVDDVSPYEADE